jgi:hypothetical protein
MTRRAQDCHSFCTLGTWRESIVSENRGNLVEPRLRSPRSAAAAGIIYSILTMTSMILLRQNVIDDPAEIGHEWLRAWSGAASAVLILVPFAGIAFLWFTGVIRDLVGGREDKFFATVFLGSGIILVVMMFIWAAAVGALMGALTVADELELRMDIFVYGFLFMNQLISNYYLRMAAVYMLSIGSLWTRAKVVPRWLTILTFIVGLGFLVFAGILRGARFIFPIWVLLVSAYILVLNYRLTHYQEAEEPSPGGVVS